MNLKVWSQAKSLSTAGFSPISPRLPCRRPWTKPAAPRRVQGEIHSLIQASGRIIPPSFRVNDDGEFSPQDEVIVSRHASCDRCEPDTLQRWVCYRASAGHSNQLGAQQYANQILASLKAAGLPN